MRLTWILLFSFSSPSNGSLAGDTCHRRNWNLETVSSVCVSACVSVSFITKINIRSSFISSLARARFLDPIREWKSSLRWGKFVTISSLNRLKSAKLSSPLQLTVSVSLSKVFFLSPLLLLVDPWMRMKIRRAAFSTFLFEWTLPSYDFLFHFNSLNSAPSNTFHFEFTSFHSNLNSMSRVPFSSSPASKSERVRAKVPMIWIAKIELFTPVNCS